MSATWSGSVLAQYVPGCGSLSNPYGPYDYNDPVARQQNLPVVERHHFNANVQSLRSGQTGSLAHDLGYTLRAFPNHHAALDSASRYELKGGRMSDQDIKGAECFFKRAIAFRPDDETVRMLYANHLVKRKKNVEAREQYFKALELAPESAEVNYNAGLFFLAEGDVVRAKELATIAYQHGYPLPGLRNKIAAAEAKGGQ
jgi:tetratricopeptide (TPR) repeat protein